MPVRMDAEDLKTRIKIIAGCRERCADGAIESEE
jgi:hypothetical protein